MTMVLERGVARKKSAKGKTPAPRVAVVVRCDEEYRDWLNGMSRSTLISASDIVRDALAKWAADRGLPPPPSGPGSEPAAGAETGRKPKGGGK